MDTVGLMVCRDRVFTESSPGCCVRQMYSHSTGGRKGLAIWRGIAVSVTAKSCTRCPTKHKDDLLQSKGLVNSVVHNIMKAKMSSFVRKSGVKKMVISIK